MKRNENCLEGLKCPKCRSLGPFNIGAFHVTTIYDDGTEEIEGVDFNNESYCECAACGFSGKAPAFKTESFRSYVRVMGGPGKMQCPGCKSLGPFQIADQCMATVRSGVIGDTGNMDWDDRSHCSCVKCDFRGEAAGFKTESFRSYVVVYVKEGPGKKEPQIFSADSEEVGMLIEGLRDVEDLIHDSCGVAGLRKDGEDEQWNDLRPDWLEGFDRAVAIADGIVQRMIRKEALDGGLPEFKEWADAASRETLTAVWDALPIGRILSGERLKYLIRALVNAEKKESEFSGPRDSAF